MSERNRTCFLTFNLVHLFPPSRQAFPCENLRLEAQYTETVGPVSSAATNCWGAKGCSSNANYFLGFFEGRVLFVVLGFVFFFPPRWVIWPEWEIEYKNVAALWLWDLWVAVFMMWLGSRMNAWWLSVRTELKDAVGQFENLPATSRRSVGALIMTCNIEYWAFHL